MSRVYVLGGRMVARSLLQTIVVLSLLGMPPSWAAAEPAELETQSAESPELSEIADQTPLEADPETAPSAAPSSDPARPAEAEEESAEPFFGDGPDPLFDDDFDLPISEG